MINQLISVLTSYFILELCNYVVAIGICWCLEILAWYEFTKWIKTLAGWNLIFMANQNRLWIAFDIQTSVQIVDWYFDHNPIYKLMIIIIIQTIHTCSFSHPLKMPSSKARILFPDKSNIRKLVNGRNSAVENIGFNESPKRLSDSFRIVKVLCFNEIIQQHVKQLITIIMNLTAMLQFKHHLQLILLSRSILES